jgi:hypothetical protein
MSVSGVGGVRLWLTSEPDSHDRWDQTCEGANTEVGSRGEVKGAAEVRGQQMRGKDGAAEERQGSSIGEAGSRGEARIRQQRKQGGQRGEGSKE